MEQYSFIITKNIRPLHDVTTESTVILATKLVERWVIHSLVGTRSAAHLNMEIRGSFCPHSVPVEKFIGTGARTDYSALGRNFS